MKQLRHVLIFIVLVLSCTLNASESFIDDLENSNEFKQLTDRFNKFISSKNLNLKSPSKSDFLELLNQFSEIKEQDPSPNSCSNRKKEGTVEDFYYFLPNLRGIFKNEGESIEFSNTCFKKNVATLKTLKDEAILDIESSEPSSLLCSDNYLVATSKHIEDKIVFMKGHHEIRIKNMTPQALADIKINGIRLLGFCQGVWLSIASLIDTARLYLGGLSKKHAKIPEAMAKKNVDFIKRFVGLDFVPRGEAGKKVLNLDKSEIKTGDFIAIVRMDGLDELIMMGTGASIGHTAVAAWIDGELYIIESQDGWYWPNHGIQRNKYDDWVKYADNADFNVVIIPLSEESRSKLNTEAAINWFKEKEGLNYGYHNFLFSWLDGVKNMPSFLDFDIFLPLFSIFSKISPPTFDLILGEALNMRLGTKGLNFSQIIDEAAKNGMSFEQLMAMPEQQGWQYSDGENYVCSCFCIGFYKAGGLFGNLEIHPQEFTPKDVYQLNIFDTNYNKPQMCKDADPDTPYCQIMGKYRTVFRLVGTIAPYTHMNEKCNSQSPDYIRNEGC